MKCERCSTKLTKKEKNPLGLKEICNSMGIDKREFKAHFATLTHIWNWQVLEW
ncbi:hypothetical protein [Desulfothermus sp.]